MEFESVFERYIDVMTDPPNFKREAFIEILKEFCKYFDLTMGVTEYYDGLYAEREGKGEIMVDYDDGREGVLVAEKRYVTTNSTVIKSKLYRYTGAKPLSEPDKKRLDIVLRALISFVSRNRLQTAVRKLAFYDEFGYPNLKKFTAFIDAKLSEGTLYGNTIVQYNIRSFSLVNRDLGKETGDIVLKNYYEQICRAAGEDGLVCRMGGDNFIAVFKNERLEEVLNVIRGCPVIYDAKREKRILISACAGVFVVPRDFDVERSGEVIGIVYPAAHEAKLERKDTIIFTDGRESAEKEKIKRVRISFSQALANDEFKAFYQPKVDINTGKVIGAEALSRWIRDGEVIPPAEFIPVLERNTEVCRLDFRILDIVCRDIRRWLDEGMPVVRVSVNLSRKHLLDVDLVDNLKRIIDDHDIPYKYLEFELTETTNETDLRNMKRIVEGLRALGLATTVDDFGMGYSSLNLIRAIPWDVIKLDKDFLPQEGDDEKSVTATMYRHVASMAQDLGLECVTEGVETKRHLEILRKNKCFIAQGFYFDKPLPKEDFEIRQRDGYKI